MIYTAVAITSQYKIDTLFSANYLLTKSLKNATTYILFIITYIFPLAVV